MDIVVGFFSWMNVMTEIILSLLIGFSLVGIKLKSMMKRVIVISVLSSLFLVGSTYVLEDNKIGFVLFCSLVFILFLRVEVPKLQMLIALLLAVSFDYSIIKLTEMNLLHLLLSQQSIHSVGTVLSTQLFMIFNHLLLIIIAVYYHPTIFPDSWFDSYLQPDNKYISNVSTNFFVIMLCVIQIIGLIYMYSKLQSFDMSFQLFIMLSSVFTYFLVNYYLTMMAKYKMVQIHYVLDREHQKELLSYYNTVRSQRHDFNHHIEVIAGLIRKQQYSECKEYMDHMVADVEHVNQLLPIHFPAVSALLHSLRQEGISKGITILFSITYDLKDMPCSVYEMNKILGNLIKNALEELEHSSIDSPVIEVHLTNENGFLIIRITNETTISEDLLHNMFSVGFTTKSSHDGIGLPTVVHLVTKNKGTVFPEINDGLLTFTVRLPLGTFHY